MKMAEILASAMEVDGAAPIVVRKMKQQRKCNELRKFNFE
jgi:hypothetical protein